MSLEEQLAEQVDPSRIASSQTISEADAKQAVSREISQFDERLKDQRIKDLEQARTQRVRYARWTFWLVLVWIAIVFLLLIFQEFCYGPHFRPLDGGVLIALVSTTTVNLIGTFVIVLKYIFHVPEGMPADS